MDECPDLNPFQVEENTTFGLVAESDPNAFEKFDLPMTKCYLAPEYDYGAISTSITLNNFTSPSLKQYPMLPVVFISKCSEVNGTKEVLVVIAEKKKKMLEPIMDDTYYKEQISHYMNHVLNVSFSMESWDFDTSCPDYDELVLERTAVSLHFKIVAGVFVGLSLIGIVVYPREIK